MTLPPAHNTYVIGDIQGCYKGLRALLEKIKFNPNQDRLIAVGDLVARGDDSLAVLSLLQDFGTSFTSVLGNHDLHFLAVANGIKSAKRSDNLDNLLASNQLGSLMDWLRQFPLAFDFHHDSQRYLVSHAGLYPNWSIDTLIAQSNKVSKRLRQRDYPQLLETMYGNSPDKWATNLSITDQCRFTINASTRMRYVGENAALDFKHKSAPKDAPVNIRPWFDVKNKQLAANETVLFGHWAALEGVTSSPQFKALDTGYVWGNALTCLRIEDQQFFRITK